MSENRPFAPEGERLARRLDTTLESMGGYLRCEVCNRERPLGDAGAKLRNGWPKCCGFTMRWWTQRQIDAGEAPSLSPQGEDKA